MLRSHGKDSNKFCSIPKSGAMKKGDAKNRKIPNRSFPFPYAQAVRCGTVPKTRKDWGFPLSARVSVIAGRSERIGGAIVELKVEFQC